VSGIAREVRGISKKRKPVGGPPLKTRSIASQTLRDWRVRVDQHLGRRKEKAGGSAGQGFAHQQRYERYAPAGQKEKRGRSRAKVSYCTRDLTPSARACRSTSRRRLPSGRRDADSRPRVTSMGFQPPPRTRTRSCCPNPPLGSAKRRVGLCEPHHTLCAEKLCYRSPINAAEIC
jgi:hypothetical protein